MRKQTYLISFDQQNVATSSLVCDMVRVLASSVEDYAFYPRPCQTKQGLVCS